MRAYAPDASAASWAMRFAAGQPGVARVLSGMNSMEQGLDNCETFAHFAPVSKEEQDIIRQAAEIINRKTAVPCTACEYCTHGCPKHIAIPQYFAACNSIMRTTGSYSSGQLFQPAGLLQQHRPCRAWKSRRMYQVRQMRAGPPPASSHPGISGTGGGKIRKRRLLPHENKIGGENMEGKKPFRVRSSRQPRHLAAAADVQHSVCGLQPGSFDYIISRGAIPFWIGAAPLICVPEFFA